MWLDQYKREPRRVAELVYWDALTPVPGVIEQRDGSFLATMRFRGPDLHSALDSALIAQAARLNDLLKRVRGHWGLLSEARRRMVTDYPVASFPDPVSRLVDDERRQTYTQPGQHFQTETYLTLVYRKPPTLLPGWQRLLYSNLPAVELDERGLFAFEEDVQRFAGLLKDCCEEVHRFDTPALLTYLKSTVSWKAQTVIPPADGAYLDFYLADMDLERLHVWPSLLKWPKLGDCWIRCVGVKAYPDATTPGMLDILESLPLEYRATVRYLPLEKAQAVKELRKLRRGHYGQRKSTGAALAEKAMGQATELLEQFALDNEQEASYAQAELQHNQVGYGRLTQTVVVWDPDFAEATRKAKQVEEALNTAQYVAKLEGVNTMAAWAASLPGNMVGNVRRPLLHTRNLAHILPMTTPWTGSPWNPHLQAPALLLTTGRGHRPFWLDLYEGDTGHCKLIAPTGAGKSTLVALMALQWLKVHPQAQVYAFDIGQSLRAATYAVGGQWFDVGEAVGQMFHAEGHLDDADFQPWASTWIPPVGRWQCFELESLLKTPRLVPGIIKGISDALDARLTGAPTLFIKDEAWRYLRPLTQAGADATFFQERTEEELRTARKKNMAVLFSTQSLVELRNSALGDVLQESCASSIYGANPHAEEPLIGAIYTSYGLNDRQRYLIANLAPKREYYYQGQRGHAVFELQLGPVGVTFAGASSKAALARIAELYQGDGVAFARDWLTERGLHAQAAQLQRFLDVLS